MPKSFRYGTALMPTVVRGIIDSLPSHLQVVDPTNCSNRKLTMVEGRFKPKELLTGRYPSITQLLSATDDLQKLFGWQKRMMIQMGNATFRKHMIERMKSGTDFHSTIQKLLKVIQSSGNISAAECRRIITEAKYPQNIGYCQGIIPVLEKIRKTAWMAMEVKTENHYLCYQGKFDAVIELDGVPTLVDWKTVSAGSIKSSAESHSLEELYGNPLQVVAYICAVNSDPKFKHMPKIKRGAVVLAFEDGRPAEIVTLNEDDIELYKEMLLERVNRFWWRIENPTTKEKRVKLTDFVYNPMSITDSTSSVSASTTVADEKQVEVIRDEEEITAVQVDTDSDVEVIGTVTQAAR